MGVLQHEQIGSIADGTKHGVRAGSEAHPGQYTLSRAHLHFVSVFLFFFRVMARASAKAPVGDGRLHIGVRHHSAVVTVGN